MCIAFVWPRSVQDQGHRLSFNILWLYLVSALYHLNPWWYLQITLLKCQLCWYDVQCLCLTKVGSRSRSEFKIKHCMTVFHVRSISFEPLVGFSNYSAQMLKMIKRCAVPMFDQYLFKVKVTVKDLTFFWLYLVSALYYLKLWWYLQITLDECQL